MVQKLKGTSSAYKIPKVNPIAASNTPPIRGFFNAKKIKKIIGAAWIKWDNPDKSPENTSPNVNKSKKPKGIKSKPIPIFFNNGLAMIYKAYYNQVQKTTLSPSIFFFLQKGYKRAV